MKAFQRYFVPATVFLLLCTLMAGPVAAGEEESPVSQPMDTVETTDTVDSTLELRDTLSYDPTRESLFPAFYYRFRDWQREIDRKIDLESISSYTTLVQGYVDPDDSAGAGSGELLLGGRWLMYGSRYFKPTWLTFRVRYRHAYANTAPSELGYTNDLLWKTAVGFTDAGFQVPDLFISQKYFAEQLTLRYGQLSIDQFFDNNRMHSGKRFFLNEAFSKNPTVNFPSYGAGFTVLWQDAQGWDFSLGGCNIQGTDQEQHVSLGLSSTALFFIGQWGYTFEGLGLKDARIQLMAWQSAGNSEDELDTGNGMSLTFEHAGKAPGERVFFRYSFSGSHSTPVNQQVSVGWGKEVRRYDYFGVGAGIGQAAEDTGVWQGVLELFYRMQITKELTISPDLQIITGGGLRESGFFHLVAGIRAGLTF